MMWVATPTVSPFWFLISTEAIVRDFAASMLEIT
jgi:hypothetical protein